MMKLSIKGWQQRFTRSYWGWVIMTFFLLILNWFIDLALGRDAVALTPNLLYQVPIGCLFGGLFFASFLSLFPEFLK